MNGHMVVDASVATKWLVEETDTKAAESLSRWWNQNNVFPAAPHLLLIEVANALFQRVKRGEFSTDDAGSRMQRLLATGVEFHAPSDLYSEAISLASQLRLGASYDAHYLALAESLDCEYWTADERFHNSVNPTYARVRSLSSFTG